MCIIETEQDEDGRWIAEVPALPGALAYGATEPQAAANVKALALQIIADHLANGEPAPRD